MMSACVPTGQCLLASFPFYPKGLGLYVTHPSPKPAVTLIFSGEKILFARVIKSPEVLRPSVSIEAANAKGVQGPDKLSTVPELHLKV